MDKRLKYNVWNYESIIENIRENLLSIDLSKELLSVTSVAHWPKKKKKKIKRYYIKLNAVQAKETSDRMWR
jgi:two-component SAPR family response regulator